MGKHQIIQTGLPSLWLNFIFELTNEIWQQLYQKSLFFRLDQPVLMRSPERMFQNADCFYSNRDF